MDKIKIFDKYFKEYDDWFIENEKLYLSEMKVIRSLMPSFNEALEIGVGTGRFASPLGIKTGVEPSENMAGHARRRGIDVHTGIAEDLPFADNSFDLALMVTTVCFVNDALKSVREAYRVLKENGCLIIGFIDKESELGKEYQRKKEKSRFYGPATFFSTREIIRMLKKAHFTDLKIKQSLFFINGGIDTESMADGYGSGSFVAVKAMKKG